LGHSRFFGDVCDISGLPPIADAICVKNRREVPCVDGSRLARRTFASQAWSVRSRWQRKGGDLARTPRQVTDRLSSRDQ
jgi:hypothetical protein